jgi:hypothetical protein
MIMVMEYPSIPRTVLASKDEASRKSITILSRSLKLSREGTGNKVKKSEVSTAEVSVAELWWQSHQT